MNLVAIILTTLISVSDFSYAQEEFTKELAFVCAIKYNNLDPTKFGELYLKNFQEDVYFKYRNDEFQFQSKINDAKNSLYVLMMRINPSDLFYREMTFDFGKYDPNMGAFPFAPFKKAPFAKRYKLSIIQLMTRTEGLSHVNLTFSNSKSFEWFEMDRTKAARFIKKRTTYGNFIDRFVYLRVYFSIIGVTEDDPNTLVGRISYIDVFADRNREVLLKRLPARVSYQIAVKELVHFLQSYSLPQDMTEDLINIVKKYQNR